MEDKNRITWINDWKGEKARKLHLKIPDDTIKIDFSDDDKYVRFETTKNQYKNDYGALTCFGPYETIIEEVKPKDILRYC